MKEKTRGRVKIIDYGNIKEYYINNVFIKSKVYNDMGDLVATNKILLDSDSMVVNEGLSEYGLTGNIPAGVIIIDKFKDKKKTERWVYINRKFSREINYDINGKIIKDKWEGE